jgi:hypothetical protein
MGLGSISNSALISLCCVFVFFLGFAFFTSYDFYLPAIALISVTILVWILSYYSRHPIDGVIIGLFVVAIFLLGYFSFECVQVYTQIVIKSRDSLDSYFQFITNILGFGHYGRLPSILSAAFAFGSMGLFFGLVGYIIQKISPTSNETHPFIFRDYWSQINGWRKSSKPEYRDLDRKFANWSILRGSLFQRLQRKITETKPELLFLPKQDKESGEKNEKGDLYDLSSGNAIGEFVDYNEIISRYKPKLVFYSNDDMVDFTHAIRKKSKKEELKLNPRGLWSLAIGELTSRLANKIAKSPVIILLYFLIAAAIVFWFVRYTPSYGSGESPMVTFFAIAIPSFSIAIIATRFWQRSKVIIEKRPDERALILSIHLCLFLIFPTIIFLAFNLPQELLNWAPTLVRGEVNYYLITQIWARQFLIWALPFVFLSVILGIGYIFVHRETEIVNAYLFDNRPQKGLDSNLKAFNQAGEVPWIENDRETDFFWVIRFMYYWRFEATFPLPHSDWERVELWVDAKNGVLKWVVSDYHYRELWYKVENPVENPISNLYVRIVTNFHTPIPVVDFNQASAFSKIFGQSINGESSASTLHLLNLAFSGLSRNPTGVLSEQQAEVVQAIPTAEKANYWNALHSKSFFGGVCDKFVSAYLSIYPYTEMRYNYGVNCKKSSDQTENKKTLLEKFGFSRQKQRREELLYETLKSTSMITDEKREPTKSNTL